MFPRLAQANEQDLGLGSSLINSRLIFPASHPSLQRKHSFETISCFIEGATKQGPG